LHVTSFRPLVPRWEPWFFFVLPVAFYVEIIAHVLIHNASHGNFPRPINRIVGELLGLVVASRFASWEIIHNRHHQHSDDRVRDPHPAIPSYLLYVWQSLVGVEIHLQRIFLDTFGDTPANRRREKIRTIVSFTTGALLFATWHQILGPVGFWFFFMPSTVFALFFVSHFNWSTHNAAARTPDYHPVDLDSGYFWFGNRLFFGIYYHATHHAHVGVFNPMRWARRRAASANALALDASGEIGPA
jgi:stearoyl-CoA desaturase (delta-9 desaturase)